MAKTELERKYGKGNIERVENLLLKDTKDARPTTDKDSEWKVTLSNPSTPSRQTYGYTPSKALKMAASAMLGPRFNVTFYFRGFELYDIKNN